jgi:superoxide oxidase
MNGQVAATRYGALSITLHWLMLLLLAAVYACIELREIYPRGSDPREALKMWHFMLGLSVLVLVVVRIVARISSVTPAITPVPSAWQALAAKLVHLALYGFMVGMPLAGWLILSAEGKPVPFFGLELPPLVGADKALAKTVEEIHETAGTVGYYLIGLHALAALFHHYVVRDNTLTRMLPGRR